MIDTTSLPLTVAVNHTCMLGEGSLLDPENKVICRVDILNGVIHEYSPGQKTHTTLPLHQMIGSVAICTNGNFRTALKSGFAFINRKNGEIQMSANPELHLPNNRFNEGKCDPAGRFWAGTRSLLDEPNRGMFTQYKMNYSP